MNLNLPTTIFLVMSFIACSGQEDKEMKSSKNPHQQISEKTFNNPLLPSGPDPYTTFHNGYYHYTSTEGYKLVLKRVKNLANLANAETKTIWVPPKNTMYSHEIWAPEIHYIEGRWFVYFAADDGNNQNHRMYVVENTSEDPFKGSFEFKGKISATTDKWAIDGNVFRFSGTLYMIWSGWEGDENGQQNIYIAKMKSPTEIDGERIKISSPTYSWEKQWKSETSDNNPPKVFVNEGPQFLVNKDKIFIVFSASGCWTDHYSLGLLAFTGKDNLLDAANWTKTSEPIFSKSIENSVYGPGHNSFFKSPDGKEDWILYHANSMPMQGCGQLRSPRMQKIKWDINGYPILGQPVSEKQRLEIPSGNL